jgi:hypothetical protein
MRSSVIAFAFFLVHQAVAQSTNSADTTSYFGQPQLSLAIAPLTLADFAGGAGLRMSGEYRIKGVWNGMTEATIYLPYNTVYRGTYGVRVRQDFRRYNQSKELFTGFSFMVKSQQVDHIAVVPINDSVRYRKNYSLIKTVICPAFVIGTQTYMGDNTGWYLEAAAYLGLRFKEAHVQGLTASEAARMWPYDIESTDFAQRIALQDGVRLQPEISASLKIGFDFGTKH